VLVFVVLVVLSVLLWGCEFNRLLSAVFEVVLLTCVFVLFGLELFWSSAFVLCTLGLAVFLLLALVRFLFVLFVIFRVVVLVSVGAEVRGSDGGGVRYELRDICWK